LRQHVADIQHHESKAAALQKHISSFKCVLHFRGTTHPKQSIQINTGCRS
jgi:hypothetical protein